MTAAIGPMKKSNMGVICVIANNFNIFNILMGDARVTE
jgi:hypothetical protein